MDQIKSGLASGQGLFQGGFIQYIHSRQLQAGMLAVGPTGELGNGSGPGPDPVSQIQQTRNESSADVAGCAQNQNRAALRVDMGHGILSFRYSAFSQKKSRRSGIFDSGTTGQS
jgi:hypothetical protein